MTGRYSGEKKQGPRPYLKGALGVSHLVPWSGGRGRDESTTQVRQVLDVLSYWPCPSKSLRRPGRSCYESGRWQFARVIARVVVACGCRCRIGARAYPRWARKLRFDTSAALEPEKRSSIVEVYRPIAFSTDESENDHDDRPDRRRSRRSVRCPLPLFSW